MPSIQPVVTVLAFQWFTIMAELPVGKIMPDFLLAFVVNADGDKALLVTYTSKASYPEDSYLWIFDKSGKPEKLKMWTSALPIDGLEASWNDWVTTESGALLPASHSILIMGLDMGLVKGTN